ncbi:hypothetical protein QMO14_33055, partial [Variovorax sp. CAN2819]|nr:hypothetical protein [Variovorax sp. CAN15]
LSAGLGGWFQSGGLGSTLAASGNWGSAARHVASNIATQGLSIATGLQKGFDWRGVAASAASGYVSAWARPMLASTFGPVGGEIATRMAGGVVSTAVRGGSVSRSLPGIIGDAVGATVGNALGDSIAAANGQQADPLGDFIAQNQGAWDQRYANRPPGYIAEANGAVGGSSSRVAGTSNMSGALLAPIGADELSRIPKSVAEGRGVTNEFVRDNVSTASMAHATREPEWASGSGPGDVVVGAARAPYIMDVGSFTGAELARFAGRGLALLSREMASNGYSLVAPEVYFQPDASGSKSIRIDGAFQGNDARIIFGEAKIGDTAEFTKNQRGGIPALANGEGTFYGSRAGALAESLNIQPDANGRFRIPADKIQGVFMGTYERSTAVPSRMQILNDAFRRSGGFGRGSDF